MVELVDALDSKSSIPWNVRVQVPPPVPFLSPPFFLSSILRPCLCPALGRLGPDLALLWHQLKVFPIQGEAMQSKNNDSFVSPTLKNAWKELQQIAPKGILNSKQMTRRQRERLSTAGYLDPIMRGWYRLKTPSETNPTTDFIMEFLPVYLEERLGARWCLSAESSLIIATDPHHNPGRLVVMAEIGSTTVHTFENGLRLTIYQDTQQLPTRMETTIGFRIMPLDTVLGRMTNTQWTRQRHLVDQVLPTVAHWEPIIWQWLSEERYQSVTRLGVRLAELGLKTESDLVQQCLQEEGLNLPTVKTTKSQILDFKDLTTIWDIWSQKLVNNQSHILNPDNSLIKSLSAIEHCLAKDAQHHLSLSGFTIPREAIIQWLAGPERAADAHGWPTLDPDERLTPPDQTDTLPGDIDPQAMVSMQGYLEALRMVKRSIVRLMEGKDLERVLRQDMRGWRLALMSPSAEAGLITRRQVLRYRTTESPETEIRATMDTWVELVANCPDESQRGILAFMAILHIKPWDQGNQRMAFLLLNALNAAIGLPWTILNQDQIHDFQKAITQSLSFGNPVLMARLLDTHKIS